MSAAHKFLVDNAIRWLQHNKYPVILSEMRCRDVHELPDIIAWDKDYTSIVLECKLSRADFARDSRKRKHSSFEGGMGRLRYFVTPKNLVTLENIELRYPRWGLVEIDDNGKYQKIKDSDDFEGDVRYYDERKLMFTALHRLQLRLDLPLHEAIHHSSSLSMIR